MSKLMREFKNFCQTRHHGKPSSRKNRERALIEMAQQLEQLGFMGMELTSLKPKHVDALVALWKLHGLSDRRMVSLISHLRWWAECINKKSVVANKNSFYGIYINMSNAVPTPIQACEVSENAIARIDDPYVRCSVRLMKVFGLSKHEAISIHPSVADQGDSLYIHAWWTSGGRCERRIPIRNDDQRQALDEAKKLAGEESLIPYGRSYTRQQQKYDSETEKADLTRLQGLRYRYAQIRYQELTGWECSRCDGLTKNQMSTREKEIDRQTRATIIQELGLAVTHTLNTYLGS